MAAGVVVVAMIASAEPTMHPCYRPIHFGPSLQRFVMPDGRATPAALPIWVAAIATGLPLGMGAVNSSAASTMLVLGSLLWSIVDRIHRPTQLCRSILSLSLHPSAERCTRNRLS